MTISLALVDDWELRGDGSGDMEKIQFDTLARILEIYESCGLRASINAEIMQQINHLRFGRQFPNLAVLAQRWEETVIGAYRRGHDVQLHVHSQWDGARYEDGKWILPGNWSILTYPRESMVRMIHECRIYLESLLQKVNTSYRCVSFRSGAWAIAPSPDILSVLVEEGIVFDMSIVSGIRYNNSVISLDYTNCDEPLLPYYPQMTDARRVSDKEEPLICVPTLSFVPSRYSLFKKDLRRVTGRLRSSLQPAGAQSANPKPVQAAGNEYQVWVEPRGVLDKLMTRCFPRVTIADLSALNFDMMKDMLTAIRRNLKASGYASIPVVLENHTKDITNFTDIERFSRYLSSQRDVEVITLAEMGARLSQGLYPVVKSKIPA